MITPTLRAFAGEDASPEAPALPPEVAALLAQPAVSRPTRATLAPRTQACRLVREAARVLRANIWCLLLTGTSWWDGAASPGATGLRDVGDSEARHRGRRQAPSATTFHSVTFGRRRRALDATEVTSPPTSQHLAGPYPTSICRAEARVRGALGGSDSAHHPGARSGHEGAHVAEGGPGGVTRSGRGQATVSRSGLD